MKIKPYSRILVDGMDGSGKTTLVQQILTLLGDNAEYVPGYNRTPEPKSPMQTWWMEHLARNPVDKVVIHDRFFYPELVYGPVLRGFVAASDSTLNYVQDFLRTHGFLIYCRPPIEVLKEGIEVQPQMEGVKEMFHDLLLAYDQMIIQEAPHYNGRFVKYDWSDEAALSKLIEKLVGYIYE